MDLTAIVLIVILCAGVVFFWPKIPYPFSWIIAAIACVICLIALASRLGVPVHL